MIHSVRPLCEGSDAQRSGASHQIGTDDSSPRRARHCGRRSHHKSHGQHDRPAVETSGESRHSSFLMCIVDQIRVRLHCTCTSRCDRSRSRGHQSQPLLASVRTMLGLDRVEGATSCLCICSTQNVPLIFWRTMPGQSTRFMKEKVLQRQAGETDLEAWVRSPHHKTGGRSVGDSPGRQADIWNGPGRIPIVLDV